MLPRLLFGTWEDWNSVGDISVAAVRLILGVAAELETPPAGAGFAGGTGSCWYCALCGTAAWTAGLSEGAATVVGEGVRDGVGGDGDSDGDEP